MEVVLLSVKANAYISLALVKYKGDSFF